MNKNDEEKTPPQKSPYLPLLFEVRNRALLIIVFFIASFLVGLFYYEKIVSLFLNLLALKGATIVFSSPFEYMNLALNCGLIVSIISTLPLIIYQLIKFIKPALTEKEYRIFKRTIPLSLFLFLAGFYTGFWMMKYVGALSFSAAQKLGVVSYLNVSNLLSVVLLTSTLMGVAFQFPLVLIFLIKMNIVRRDTLISKRPLAYIIAIIFASLMPPTDFLSLILLTIPLVFLFEIVLLFTK
uniref:Sec-independent protein translocase protein TatC n=1 Tax=candidate division CPR3 bacterium TaxID=2268181 RepID=A0A7C4R5D7_UNCC3